MDSLEPAPAVSISKVTNADSRTFTPTRQSNKLAWRKRRTFPQSASRNVSVADEPTAQSAQEPAWVSYHKEADFKFAEARIFLKLQKSFMQDLAIESVTGLRLDNLIPYGVSEHQQKGLWRLEAKRLVTAIERGFPQNPLTSATDKIYLYPDHTGFEVLSRVSDEIVKSIELCDSDNKLECWLHSDEVSLTTSEISEGRRTNIRGGEVARMAEATKTIPEEQRRRFYCFLVDYVSAVAAIHASHDAADRSADYIASLARCAAKLKLFGINMGEKESMSISRIDNRSYDRGYYPRWRSFRVDKSKTDHFRQIFSASTRALEDLRSIFRSLKCESKPGVSDNALNIGFVVYKGWSDASFVLSQDQRGDVCGTSMRSDSRSVREVYRTLDEITRNIGRCLLDIPQQSQYPSWHASIVLGRSLGPYGANETHTERELRTLAEVVLYMVPLLSMHYIQLPKLNDNPRFVKNSTNGRKCTETTAISVAGLQVFFSTTNRSPRPIASSLRTLSAVYSVKEMRDARSYQRLNVSPLPDLIIEDKAVVLKLRLYVSMTMAACGILVFGGILAAFLVGERIPGVDPFNIATFAWALAAFIIIVAKAVYVREWPWYDFLRGQLYCGSVSSLSAITGVDEQDILKFLLVSDPHAVLTTRGPFNRLFTRRSEDGFSIDVMMTLRTLRASGIVVVEVETNKGPALVCLDLRLDAGGRTSICNSDGPREGENLIGCFDSTEDLEDAANVRLHVLSRSMTWTRITGIYNNMDKRFR